MLNSTPHPVTRDLTFACLITLSGLIATSGSTQAGPIGCALLKNCQTESGTEVEPTGVIHTIYIIGDTFFPSTVHAELGDEIKFYNLRNAALKVRAVDYSWISDAINKNFSWSLMVQPGVELEFRNKSFGFTTMRGKVTLDAPPSDFDYGDLIDYRGNVVGKNGDVIRRAEGLGYTMAENGGTARNVGNGKALGRDTSVGQGNN